MKDSKIVECLGEQGDTGQSGPTGATGVRGPTGASGARGQTGAKGMSLAAILACLRETG